MIEIIHKCQKCKEDGGEKIDCTCDSCVSEIEQEAYDKGYADAKEEFEPRNKPI